MLNYFKLCPSRSFKSQRVHLIPKFIELYELRAYQSDSIHHPL